VSEARKNDAIGRQTRRAKVLRHVRFCSYELVCVNLRTRLTCKRSLVRVQVRPPIKSIRSEDLVYRPQGIVPNFVPCTFGAIPLQRRKPPDRGTRSRPVWRKSECDCNVRASSGETCPASDRIVSSLRLGFSARRVMNGMQGLPDLSRGWRQRGLRRRLAVMGRRHSVATTHCPNCGS